jgi:cytochrome bd-type quinol oxidase subunit 2
VRRVFTSIAPTIVTGIAGLITLVSFFGFLVPGLSNLRIPLVNIAVIVAGMAVVMGFVHLLYVHSLRLRRRQSAVYSLILIVVAIVTLVILVLDRASPDRAVTRFIFDDLIVPLQSALSALLAVFLALAAVRMLHNRRGFGSIWFLLAALIVLVTQIPLSISVNPDGTLTELGQFATAVRQILDALTTGGLRGLLLGVALGTIATAFRVLFFIDRPQSE